MSDFDNLFASDFGFKPQGKSAPMAAPKPSPTLNPTSDLNFDLGSRAPPRPTSSSASYFNRSTADDPDSIFSSGADRKTQDFSDLFGGSATKSQSSRSYSSAADFDSAFSGLGDFSAAKSSARSGLHDKPVYDDDIFEGLPGLNSSSSGKYESAFSSFSSIPKGGGGFDDLLAGFGVSEKESKSSKSGGSRNAGGGSAGFEDLIPGFGRSSPPKERSTSGPSWHSEPTFSTGKTAPSVTENPFVVLESSSPAAASTPELFTDPLEEISKPDNSGSVKVDKSSSSDGKSKSFDDVDPFDGLGKFAPTYTNNEPHEQTSVRSPERSSVDSDKETRYMPKVSDASPPSHADANFNEADLHHVDVSSGSEERFDSSDDVWLTVSEIPLSTEPTRAPPPSRPPPPRPTRVAKDKTKSFSSAGDRRKDNDSSNFNSRSSAASPFDEFEDFTGGGGRKGGAFHANGVSSEEFEMSSTAAASAAAMKDAMERAEAKFRHAKEVRGRETTKSSRSRESVDKDEKAMQDAQDRARREKQERLDHERIQREMEEEERLQKKLEREREEKEREQMRLEKERERAREIEREREHARQAVQRATREARERAATEARLKAERAAVGKINAEARERAERSAVQRAQAEARERAAADARERAEKAAAEARGRANAEAREKEAQERAAVAKAEAEARVRAERAAVQRAAQEARERAAAAARMNQQKNENDLDNFFNMGRASSAPRPRATPPDPMFDTQFQNKQGSGAPKPSATSSSMKKASSTTNITNDLASIFGGAPSSGGDFQDVEGESEERRRARLERHQRTQERAAKALDEKNQRDLQAQRDQAERNRISETLDMEIKRWAAGKEGNLRALLSTLQYVLWPECGWQPVSLTDLITAAMVKKVYRKSTLCIHPDKVQQKGATLQQKYIAEKVFDILKEAWNKFNSEELF